MAKLIIDDESFESEKPKANYISFRTIINDDTLSTALYRKGTANIQKMKSAFFNLIKSHPRWNLNIFKDKDTFFIHVQVPSEKVKGFSYDVVIRSETQKDKKRVTINNNPIKVFSNSPSFLFQYAYICNQQGILIEELKDKVGELALTTPPKNKNPLEQFGFEKSVYFACMYIKYNELNYIKNLDINKRSGDMRKYFANEIKSCQAKLKDYNYTKSHEKPFMERQKTTFKKYFKKVKKMLPKGFKSK